MFTYPFTDAVLDGSKGSYLNLYLTINAETLTMTPNQDGNGFTDTRKPGADVAPLMGPTPPPLPIPSASGTTTLLPGGN